METETARNLPAKLVSLRKQKGITQMELAEKLNVSRQAISRWEVGLAVPTTDNLKVLSELYGVSIDYLLNDAAENVSKQNEVKQDQSSASETEEKKRIPQPQEIVHWRCDWLGADGDYFSSGGDCYCYSEKFKRRTKSSHANNGFDSCRGN